MAREYVKMNTNKESEPQKRARESKKRAEKYREKVSRSVNHPEERRRK